MIKVSVVIPNFNGEKLLEENLPFVLHAKTNEENHISEIIVVDDYSSDQSVQILKTKFPEIKLIKHKINKGFSSSVNTGVRSAKGELIALLNTDVIPGEDFLVTVLPHFENKNVFAVSLHEKSYGWARGIFKDGFIVHEPGPEDNKIHNTFWVNGGSGVFRKLHWLKLGGMDEKLLSPFYWEDIDLCYRAAKRGWLLLWEPKAIVTHIHEATISKLPGKSTQRIMERNQLLFIWKNLTSNALSQKHMNGLIKRILKNPGYLIVVLMALTKIKEVLIARKKEKREGFLSDEAIFAKFS